MLRQRLMWIAWPAFLVAGVLEMLVFSVLDPESMQIFGEPLEWSREAVYTLAFFVFWVMLMVSGGLTLLLARSSPQVNGFEHAEPVQPPADWTPPEILR